MKRPYQHCPRAAVSRSARISNTASSGSDGGAARPCTPTPTPPFDTRAPGVAFGPPWAATRAATRDDFFDSGGGGGTNAGSICFAETMESARLSVKVRSIGCPSTARSSV
eukprot:scaffold77547_cov39-Phaeocystis_antarctica.AAC.1